MKKSTIFLIAIIYIVSIVVVTFFGLQIRVDQFKVYMTSIEITTYDKVSSSGLKSKTITFDGGTEGYCSIFIDYRVGPDNATNQEDVEFLISNNTYVDEISGETVTFAKITSNGELMFFEHGTVYVTIRTIDGSALSDKVLVRCKTRN